MIDEWNAYITYFASDHENLVVEYTKDGRNGYLLYCSTPGAGQMTKLLFRTENAGETFSFVRLRA